MSNEDEEKVDEAAANDAGEVESAEAREAQLLAAPPPDSIAEIGRAHV